MPLLCFFAFTSCGDDDHLKEDGPKIDRSEVSFDAVGGRGTIAVSDGGALTATADKDWCSVSVSGSTVTVTVAANPDMTGRTALVSIEAGGSTLAVPVTQAGVILAVDAGELVYTLAGGTKEVIVTKNNMPYTVEIPGDAGWAGYTVSGDTIRFTLAEAAMPRATGASIKAGNVTKNVVLSQQRGYADLLGDWTLQHSAGSFDVTLVQKVENSSYTMNGFVISGAVQSSIELRYNASNGRLVIPNLQYLGDYGIYVYMLLRGANYYAIEDAAQYEGTLDMTQSELTYRFADNGTWTVQAVTGLYLVGTYSDPTVSVATAFASYMDVVLVKK
jgi:hypothetical protein